MRAPNFQSNFRISDNPVWRSFARQPAGLLRARGGINTDKSANCSTFVRIGSRGDEVNANAYGHRRADYSKKSIRRQKVVADQLCCTAGDRSSASRPPEWRNQNPLTLAVFTLMLTLISNLLASCYSNHMLAAPLFLHPSKLMISVLRHVCHCDDDGMMSSNSGMTQPSTHEPAAQEGGSRRRRR